VKGATAYVHTQYQDLPYLYVDEGRYFGEMEIFGTLESARRIFTTKALQDSEFLVLNKHVRFLCLNF
jgi:hypothetical protein